jgi:iron-sulfur cluster assembly protein
MARQQESRSFVAPHERGVGSVLKVVEGGSPGFQYSLDIDTPPAGAQACEKDGATVLRDPNSVLYLSGTVRDYKNDLMQSAFVFNNR